MKITTKKHEIFIKKYANKGKTLDIGCADGYYSKYFPHCIGTEIY